MTISLRLAWRNLWRHKRRTWLTTGAMIFSNVLLVFLISWQFAMYELMVDNSLRLMAGHIQIQHREFLDEPRIDHSFALDPELVEHITSKSEVVAISPRSEGFALASSEKRSYGMQIIGVNPQTEASVSSLPGLLKAGTYLSKPQHAEIVLGHLLAKNLKADIGDEITIFGSAKDGSTAAAILTLVGLFESSSADIDRAIGFISLQQFDEIFAMEGEIHRLVIMTENPDGALLLAQELTPNTSDTPKAQNPSDNVIARDWNALQPELQQAIQSDMASSWFMYIVLIMLVAFSVLNTQLMSVLERTKEYGIMMALGLNSWRLSALVFVETALMAGLGFILGMAIGSVIILYLGIVGFTFPGMEEMTVQFNLPSTIYPDLRLLTAALGPSLIFCASLCAAIYPALRLHRLRIVHAMRAPG